LNGLHEIALDVKDDVIMIADVSRGGFFNGLLRIE